MPVAFSYIRFSSAEQAHGDSLTRQQEYVAKWLLAHPEFVLSGASFQDLGISGYSGKHLENGFGKLLAAVESGVIKSEDVVLIEAIDRAGRLEPSVMLHLLTGIVNAGVKLITLDDGITYSNEPNNSNNLFLLVAKVQQAHQYSDALSRRIKDAYTRKREKAAAGDGVKRHTPIWLTSEGELVEGLAPIIVQVFEDYADGLGERRILSRIRGKHPSVETTNPTTLKRWLRNPTAIGRWNDIEDVYPPVVSKELWYRVQKRLQDGYVPRSAPSKYLLSGLVRCGRCGTNYCVVDTKRSPAVMRCYRRHCQGADGCTNRSSIPMHVLDFVRSQTMYGAMQRAAQSRNLTSGEKRLIEIEGELTELQRQSANLAESLAEFGMLPPIRSKLEQVAASIQRLEQERALLKVAPAPVSMDDMVDLQHTLLDDDQMRLNALLQGVGYIIVCDGTTITVDEPHLQVDGEHQVYEYKGAQRSTEMYRVIESGQIEHLLDMPNSKRVAAAQAEFVSTPITQELHWNGLQFVDVATKLVVEVVGD